MTLVAGGMTMAVILIGTTTTTKKVAQSYTALEQTSQQTCPEASTV